MGDIFSKARGNKKLLAKKMETMFPGFPYFILTIKLLPEQ